MSKIRKLILLISIITISTHVHSDMASATTVAPKIVDVSQTVLQIPLKQGITPGKAVYSMIRKANDLQMNIISHQRISATLKSRGIQSRHLEVLQLCPLEDAAQALQLNFILGTYMPCRITLAEDDKGINWIVLQNIDIQINNKLMNPSAVELAIRLNQNLLSIVNAGVNGE